MAKTLSLGQAGYQLLEADSPSPVLGSTVTTAMRGTTASRIFDVRNTVKGATIDNLSIGTDYTGTYTAATTSTVNVYDPTAGLQANLGDGRDTLNLFGNADAASIEMDATDASGNGGADLLNAQKAFTNSSVTTGLGNDTIRVGGVADGSSFYMGAGNDSLYVAGASQGVYADGGAGSDFITFVGSQTDALAFGGEDNDSITFTGGLTGTNSGLSAFELGSAGIDAGAGNDTIVFGTTSSSSYFFVSTGDGVDVLQLNGFVSNAGIWLGGDNPTATAGRDSVSFGGTSFSGSSIASNNTLGDTVVFGASSAVDTSTFTMGSGSDSLVFGGGFNSSAIDLGLGADTLTFGTNSFVGSSIFNLGNDGSADVISFLGGSAAYTDITITGADENDVLYIGSIQYGYVASTDSWVFGADTLKFS